MGLIKSVARNKQLNGRSFLKEREVLRIENHCYNDNKGLHIILPKKDAKSC